MWKNEKNEVAIITHHTEVVLVYKCSIGNNSQNGKMGMFKI